MSAAEEIVRSLAASDPVGQTGHCQDPICTLCQVDAAVLPRQADGAFVDLSEPDNHATSCPWRLAIEWLDARHWADEHS